MKFFYYAFFHPIIVKKGFLTLKLKQENKR